MSDIAKFIEALSPEQRELLLLRLNRFATPGDHASQARIPRQSRSPGVFPLSFAQQRLWFLDQLDAAQGLYSLHVTVRLTGTLDDRVLEQAINQVICRHESLRTTFPSQDGKPVQQIAPAIDFSLPLVDVCNLSPQVQQAETSRLAAQEARYPFDLAQRPLLRVVLLRWAAAEHIMLLTLHHIIADGWSLGILLQEVATFYQALSGDAPVPLPELPIQYVDFAIWQQHWLQGDVLQKQLSYWTQQLSGPLPILTLPREHARPAVSTFRSAKQAMTLAPEPTQVLKVYSQQAGVTLFMTLLAAFQTWLYRYTGQTDILVGTPIAGRNRDEIEGLIGLFVNTLVLRTDLSGKPTFRELLGRVRQTTLDAFAHQDLPFEKLVEELQPQRDLSHSPLFQVMFVLQNTPMPTIEIPGLMLQSVPVDATVAQFDLVLTMVDTSQGLKGVIEYNADVFEAMTIARWAEHLKILLEGIVANPDEQLSSLRLLTQAERGQLLEGWNNTQSSYPHDVCIHQLFERRVEQTPDAIALVYSARADDLWPLQLTYRELNRRANQLARYLQGLGVRPDTRVGVCVERSADMAIGVLAILKAGGAYVPLDPAYPSERLTFMLEDAQASVLLTQQQYAGYVPSHQAWVICLDADWADIVPAQGENLTRQSEPENLAYVIYTSGSTGRPKGTAVSDRALVNHSLAVTERYGLSSADRVLQFASIGFDVMLEELFPSWLSGAAVVVRPDGGLILPAELEQFIERERLTVVNLPTAYWREWMAGWSRVNRVAAYQPRCVIVGTEKALPESLTIWQQQAESDIRWCNAYGLTEATVTSTIYELPLSWQPQGVSGIPIGRPIANTRAYVLQADGQLSPIGVSGELYIGGNGLARGYLNCPDLTAERFLPDPFSREPGARLCRTGDVARYLPDGNLEVLGRVDSQVKIRGFRIELQEIEWALSQHPSVREAVVVAQENLAGDKQLVAFIVPQHAESGNSYQRRTELRGHLKKLLPVYMVPAAWVWLDSLPLTPNGKIDYRALPAAGPNDGETDDTVIAPRTPVEEILTSIWATVLGMEQVGLNDNFFELGGHSLLATQVISRVAEILHVQIPLRCLFETPTAAGLAQNIMQARWETPNQHVPPLVPVSRAQPLPLSFAQQRLYFLNQLEPGSPSYNMPVAVRVSGSLDLWALSGSWNEILRRHESLRTTFAFRDGSPVQIIWPAQQHSLPLVNLSEVPEPEQEIHVQRLAVETARQAFDLARGPLVQVVVLQLNEHTHIVLVTLHHIVGDDWSLGVLVRELGQLYEVFTNDRPSPLPELALQYVDYAVWQRQWLQGEALAAGLTYWKQRLAVAPLALNLPADYARPPRPSFQGSSQSFKLSKSTSEKLKALSRCEGVTLFMTLLAVLKTLLHRYSGQDDIVVGTGVANRNWLQVEDLVGFFVNMLVLHTNLSGNPTFRELLARVRETTLEAYQHQDIPFDKIVEELCPGNSLGRTPWLQVVLVLQNAPLPDLSLPGLKIDPVVVHTGMTHFDLTLSLADTEDGLAGTLEYSLDLFRPSTISQMLEHYAYLLEFLVQDPEMHLLDVPLWPGSSDQEAGSRLPITYQNEQFAF